MCIAHSGFGYHHLPEQGNAFRYGGRAACRILFWTVVSLVFLTTPLGTLSAQDCSDLIAYWSFDSDVADESGHPASDLENHGGAADPGGRFGACYYFPSGAFAKNVGIDLAPLPRSISMWINVNSYATENGSKVIHNWGLCPPDYAKRGATLSMNGNIIVASDGHPDPSAGAATPHEWTHFAFVYDSTGTTVYRNGTCIRHAELDLITLSPPTPTVWVGDNGDSGDWWGSFDGRLDDVCIFSKSLSAAEVAYLYHCPLKTDNDADSVYDFCEVSEDIPTILTDGGEGTGADYHTTLPDLELNGTCPSGTQTIRVNDSTDGVQYTPGSTTWSCEATMLTGPNTFFVTAVDATAHVSPPDSITVFLDATTSYSLDNATQLASTSPLKGIMWPVWSSDGTKVAYVVTDNAGNNEVFVADLRDLSVTQVLSSEQQPSARRVAWSPEDDSIFFTLANGSLSKCSASYPFEVTGGLLTPAQVGGEIMSPSIMRTPYGERLVFVVGTNVYMASLDEDGNPLPSTVTQIFSDGGPGCDNPSLSPSGDALVLEAHGGIGMITEVKNIAEGSSSVPNNNDRRVHSVGVYSQFYTKGICWSADAQLVFYAQDKNRVFNGSNFDETDFDIVAERTVDVLDQYSIPYHIEAPGNQGMVDPSRGGTRLCYVDYSSTAGGRLYAATLRITQQIQISEAGISRSGALVRDGAGTTLEVLPGTTCDNMGTGLQTLVVFTPITPVEEAQLGAGVEGLPVVRHFGPVGATFTPAARMTLRYSDAEIEGYPEEELAVFQYNEETGLFDTQLTVVERDTEANVLTVEISTFGSVAKAGSGDTSAIVVGIPGEHDTDGDGLSDDVEETLGTDPESADTDHDGLSDHQEVYWDGDGALNAYDPDINPTGTDLNPLDADTDGDGVRDGSEAGFGSDPLDPADTVELSIDGWAVVPLLVLLAGWMVRRGASVRRDPR